MERDGLIIYAQLHLEACCYLATLYDTDTLTLIKDPECLRLSYFDTSADITAALIFHTEIIIRRIIALLDISYGITVRFVTVQKIRQRVK